MKAFIGNGSYLENHPLINRKWPQMSTLKRANALKIIVKVLKLTDKRQKPQRYTVVFVLLLT